MRTATLQNGQAATALPGTAATTAAGNPATVIKYLYDGDNVLADYAPGTPGSNDIRTAIYVTPELKRNLSITNVQN